MEIRTVWIDRISPSTYLGAVQLIPTAMTWSHESATKAQSLI